MSQRRMFSPRIIDSDAFLEMSATAQLLYFHLGMRADDDGFVSNPRRIIRTIGVNEDDLKLLLTKRFVLGFENGIVVIKHWRINNYIKTDRYQETVYLEQKNQLKIKENGSYTEYTQTECIQNVSTVDTQVRLGKVRLGKVNIKSGVFTPPLLEEIKDYCLERKNEVNPEQFVDFYSSKGWMIGKNKMKDWRAAVRTWEKRSNNFQRVITKL